MNQRLADWLIPDWPAPAGIKSCVTTRSGGVSIAPFDSFNLGDHVDDDPAAVASNREALMSTLDVQPAWLSQVHGVNVVEATPAEVAALKAWRQYRVLLNRIEQQLGFPVTVEWPKAPS